MFNNVKAKKRLTQFIVAFVVICMSVTGSFLLLKDSFDKANAETYTVNVASAGDWTNAVSGKRSGDIVNITLTGDVSVGALLQAIPAGVTVNLSMNNKTIAWDTVATGTASIMDENYSDGIRTDFWGLITNNGTLNITGTGTIRMQKVNYNYKANGAKDNFATKSCAIVNNGTMTIGSGISVINNTAMAANDQDGSNKYMDTFVYGCAIYNNSGTLTTSGKISSNVMGSGISVSDSNSFHYAFSYGIYGGNVTTKGGTVSSEAKSGSLMATSSCKEGNHVVSVATGIFSNAAKVLGDTTITSKTSTWDSPGGYDAWSGGIDISISTGIMYIGTNYPVIGASVDIDATFFCPGESDFQAIVPGTQDYYTVKNKTGPGNYARRAYPIAGATQLVNTIGDHKTEKEWSADGGFFGTVDAGGPNDVEKRFNMNGNMYYYPEEAYFGGFTGSSYRENANGQFQRESGQNNNQTATGSFRSGVPGTIGTQYKVIYRYYNEEVASSKLVSVSPKYDAAIQSGPAVIHIGGNSTHNGTNNNGAIPDAGQAMTFGSGGASQNSYYYKLASTTYEKVPTATFANRNYENKSNWANNGTQMTGSVTMTSENTLVIYMNYVLKSPSAIRVVAGNSAIDQYTTTKAFTANYTGKALVPGTDFQLGIIDMGINTSVDTNDASDDTVVTNVYNITGTGSGSGNNATAVTYRYTTDQTTWNNGLPKDAGTYIIEVNVNADVTFAKSGTYNRQATSELISCTISKANVSITGANSKNGTYGSTYGELVPFADYKASGLASDQLEGSWSYAGIDAGTYPNAGQSTIHLVWTPTANTSTANNYNSTTFAVALNVAKRNVTVSAGASTVTYGDSKPAYVISYENLAPCDEAKKTEWFNTTTFQVNGGDYKAGLAVGTYPARIVDFGGAADENNIFTVADKGTLEVTKRNIVYNAVAIDRDYNGSANVDVKLNYVSGNYSTDVYDTTISTTGTMPAGADAGEGKQVSVKASDIIIKNFENYNLVINNVDSILVNIAKATPTGVSVVADPAIVTYDSTKTLATATTLKPTATTVAGSWTWKSGTTVPTVDVPKYIAVFTPDSENYKSIEQEVIFTVEQKEVVVTVKDFAISYGDAVPAISGSLTYTGFTGKDTVNNIGANGGVDATTTYTRGSGIGEYPVTVISNLTSTNYYFTAVNNKIVVNPRALKVTAMNQSVTYGDQVPELDASDLYFEGFYGTDNHATLGGMAVINTSYTPGKGVGTYPITVTGFTSTNYAIEFVNGELTVNKAVLTVTPNNVAGVTYGADAPAYAVNRLYTFSGFKGTDTAENVVIEGAPAFSTGYQSGSNAGTYPVTVAVNDLKAANYTFAGKEGTLTVGKATPAVTQVPGASVINLDSLAKATFDNDYVVVNSNKASMTVTGTFAFADGTIVPVYGSFAEYNAVFTPIDTVNYTTTTVRVGVEVKVRTISGKPVIQGSAMAGSTLSLNLDSMDPKLAQYYTIEWYADDAKISGANGTTYKIADGTSDIGKVFKAKLVANEALGFTGFAWTDPTSAVIQALLETTAAQLNAIFSDAEYDAMSHGATVTIKEGFNPDYFGAITVKYNGLTQAPTDAGTYIVTVDVGVPKEPAGGYPADTYYGPATGINVGTITITPATIDIKVQAADKVYDGTTDATVVIEPISGLKDENDYVAIAPDCKFAFADARVGTDKEVKVISMQLIGDDAGNYKINVLPVYASITQRTLKVRVNGVTKTFDNSKNVAVTFSNVEGYAPIDSASTVYLTNGTAQALSADAGTQNITDIYCTLAGSSAANYVVEYVNADTATVVITPATPNVDAPVINGVEYDAAKTLQTIDLAPYTTSGGFWQFNDLTIVPTVSQKTYAATYKSTNKNYTDLVTVITVNVDPKAVVLTADDKSVAYGTKAPVFTVTASGLTGEDTLADIGGSCTPVCTYAPGSPIGSYTINLNNALSDDNYIFTTVPGTLTVAPARITVTATAENKVYNGTADITVNFDKNLTGKYGNDDVTLSTFSTIGQAATVNAGATTVTYIAPILIGAKADNYELYVTPASGALTVEITKADVTGVIFPVDGKVEFGYDLRFATFEKNGVGDGTFAYENAKNIIPSELGFYEYKVIFTPTDARNYNTQEAMVSLEVVKCVLDYVVGIAGTTQNGESLVVVTTGLPPMAENYIQYQWYRTDGTKVEAIEGANSDRYVATDDDVGYTLFVITFFDEADPYVFSDNASQETIDGEIYGIIGQTTDKIKEVALSFWQRLINWINRIIAALTGLKL